jgi:hypothetical protein
MLLVRICLDVEENWTKLPLGRNKRHKRTDTPQPKSRECCPVDILAWRIAYLSVVPPKKIVKLCWSSRQILSERFDTASSLLHPRSQEHNSLKILTCTDSRLWIDKFNPKTKYRRVWYRSTCLFYQVSTSSPSTLRLGLTRAIVAFYGLEVPCGDVLVPAVPDFPATVSDLIF